MCHRLPPAARSTPASAPAAHVLLPRMPPRSAVVSSGSPILTRQMTPRHMPCPPSHLQRLASPQRRQPLYVSALPSHAPPLRSSRSSLLRPGAPASLRLGTAPFLRAASPASPPTSFAASALSRSATSSHSVASAYSPSPTPPPSHPLRPPLLYAHGCAPLCAYPPQFPRAHTCRCKSALATRLGPCRRPADDRRPFAAFGLGRSVWRRGAWTPKRFLSSSAAILRSSGLSIITPSSSRRNASVQQSSEPFTKVIHLLGAPPLRACHLVSALRLRIPDLSTRQIHHLSGAAPMSYSRRPIHCLRVGSPASRLRFALPRLPSGSTECGQRADGP